MKKKNEKNELAVFIWNLYEVRLTNRSEPILVCAPSFIGAIKRVVSLVLSWDDADKYEIESIRICGVCIN